MRREDVRAGMYESPGWSREFPRVQTLKIEELLEGKKPDVPPMRATIQRAERLRSGARHGQNAMSASEQSNMA